MSTVLLLLLIGLPLLVLLAYFLFGSFLYGAGYQPTPPEVARRMIEFGDVQRDDHVLDLGAGTGALLFLAARSKGATVTGVEAEPLRYLFLKIRKALSSVGGQVSLVWGDLFAQDLSEATVLVMFLWPGAMARLKVKFESELTEGVRVVSYWHPLPGVQPDRVDEKLKVYLYVWKGAAQRKGSAD